MNASTITPGTAEQSVFSPETLPSEMPVDKFDNPLWKHGVFFGTDRKPNGIAVFDDECQGKDVIYHYYKVKGTDIFSPCRTVSRHSRAYWTRILEAWSSKAPLVDFRNDRSIPLPS